MDGLTRTWDESVGVLATNLGTAGFFLSIALAAVVGLLWYFYPAWLPVNWPRHRRAERPGRATRTRPRRARLRLRWRWRRRRRRRGSASTQAPVPSGQDAVPDLPAAALVLSADQLAAAGRFAEAVRERLRAILRGLVERGLLPASPGWTVMELAAAGGRTVPALAGPLTAAAATFSEIWYGLRPATAADDAAMRAHASAVEAALAGLGGIGAPLRNAPATAPGRSA